MTRPEFEEFIDKTLREVILNTELHTKKSDLNDFEFQWYMKDSPVITDRDEIIKSISSNVYVDTDKIYPCIDLDVLQIKGNTIVVKAGRANYEPRPFGKCWSNRPGPFIYKINVDLIHPSINTSSKEFQDTLRKNGLIHY
jgi:hypothetical protein